MEENKIPEAKEGSIAHSNGCTYYVDKTTGKAVKINPDGTRTESPIKEYPSVKLSDVRKP
jgi:hypothetical protein